MLGALSPGVVDISAQLLVLPPALLPLEALLFLLLLLQALEGLQEGLAALVVED